MFLAKLDKYRDWGILILRVIIGVIFTYHGLTKIFGLFAGPGINGFSSMLEGLGFPIPLILSVIVGVVELAGGIALIIGFLTRYAAILLAIVMIVAIISVHIGDGLKGMEFPLSLLAATIALLFNGCGSLGIDRKLFGL